jgi:hypothetical protein
VGLVPVWSKPPFIKVFFFFIIMHSNIAHMLPSTVPQRGLLGPSSTPNQSQPTQQRLVQNALTEANQLRVAAVRERLQGRHQTPRAEFGTTNTTESLLHHEHGGGEPGQPKLTIGWQVRIMPLFHSDTNYNLWNSILGSKQPDSQQN